MRVIDFVNRYAAETLLLESEGSSVVAGELTNSFSNAKNFVNRSVLIATSRIEEAIHAICRLDGWVKAIGFCPHNFRSSEIDRIAKQGGFDAILGEGAGDVPRFPDCNSLVRFLWDSTGECESHSTSWVMMTSGTTGTPKLVLHSLKTLTSTTKISKQGMQGVRWGMLYDYTRFAGMQVVLQSLLSGAVLVAPDLTDSIQDQLQFLAANGTTHLSTTPTMWRKILMTPCHEQLSLKVATLGGEIADQAILDALKRSYPDARIIHIYASTEAGVGFSVKDGVAGFPESYVTAVNDKMKLRVVDERLEVFNPDVGKNYLGSHQNVSDEEGWVATGDLVEQANGRFFFQGRANGTINVGGNKVMPETVEAALIRHPNVALSRVYAKKNPFSGSLVVADIVLARKVDDEPTLKQAILESLKSHLEPFQIPVKLKIVDSIETTTAGKIVRNGP
ncbi:MAG: fatty acid--CoA ligase family protein [Planctomycetota bacterium]